ncbi:GNAT family N-acetyltransferase [Ramlibacter sp. XY19]|uniref:GNAT family N-acetyltransferase n=1 Tax=Ramlibacter paludis TaxID=2908000 RepID=UPI0023DBF3C0|nr:GNAT family N-acetyltransferase [Ramlibacter paludis]MCG2595861.1 GNAT family N-acetyltransferase [Ramlibacter paludis]
MQHAIRPMQKADLPHVLALQEQAYAGADFEPERVEVYANRMALAPQFCLVDFAPDGHLQGYLVSHPWREAVPPALDAILDCLPQAASCWYLHDCAVDARAKGRGVAARLHHVAVDRARALGLRRAALVAVGDAAGFWRRLGYAPRELPGMRERLKDYGPEAAYMERLLA